MKGGGTRGFRGGVGWMYGDMGTTGNMWLAGALNEFHATAAAACQ